MFSGIVETIGSIISIKHQSGCMALTISPHQLFNDLSIGDSIAVNGACLTVTQFTEEHFTVTVVPETLRLTNLHQLTVGDQVNLERSLKAEGRIGGHYVQGHVDGMGQILAITNDDSDAWLVKISIPPTLSRYIVKKGYIGIDGMSITVIDVTSEWFTVTFVPHTQTATIVPHYRPDSWVNIEVDIMGKYIEKIIGAHLHAISN